jgi:uncharacterized protein YdhG (YjbR/CyaY superfamily)
MNAEVLRYIEAVDDERRPLFDKLQALILGLYPDAKVVLSYQVPTYKTSSGWAALGYWKSGVSVYTNGPHNISEFKAEFPHIKTGKGSINFKVTDALPKPALEKVITHAMEGRREP